MLPYQAMPMDFAVTSSFQRHHQLHGPHQGGPTMSSLNLNNLNNLNGLNNLNSLNNLNPSAFSHSWFVPPDLCAPGHAPLKQSQGPLFEPGHVCFLLFFLVLRLVGSDVGVVSGFDTWPAACVVHYVVIMPPRIVQT